MNIEQITILLRETNSSYNALKMDANATEKEKFNLLNIIIQFKYILNQDDLYQDIKSWLYLYLMSIVFEEYSYDEIIYDKVVKKLAYLDAKQQYSLVNYFIRLLKKESYEEHINRFEKYKKELEIEILKNDKRYVIYIFKTSTIDLGSLLITLFYSLIVFSFIWCVFAKAEFMEIDTIQYTNNLFINYFFNIISYVFSTNKELEFEGILELLFMLIIKLFYYVLISYFIIKEFIDRINKV